MKSLLALLLASSPLVAQTSRQQQLYDALILEKRGRFDQAIVLAKQAVASNQLSAVEAGRAFIILGLAYEMEGSFTEAAHAFDHSLLLLAGDVEHRSDYAAALDNYAGLYVDAGRLDEAATMWHKALHLRQQLGDHAATTRSLVNLAGLALAQKRVKEARTCLKEASAEMKLARDIVDDDLAIVFETQAWLALAEGNPREAVAGYQRALEISKRSRGERHWLTGYEYVLLGKAWALAGDTGHALAAMQQGLSILGAALDPKNPKYLAAEISFAQVLDRAGSHAEARRINAAAQQTSKDFYRGQCVGCTISVAAFR